MSKIKAFRLPEELIDRLESIAAERGISVNSLAAEILSSACNTPCNTNCNTPCITTGEKCNTPDEKCNTGVIQKCNTPREKEPKREYTPTTTNSSYSSSNTNNTNNSNTNNNYYKYITSIIQKKFRVDNTEIKQVLREYCVYLDKKNRRLEEASVDILLSIAEQKCGEFGETAVIEVIRECMASGYNTIYFDRLERNYQNEKQKYENRNRTPKPIGSVRKEK